MYLQEKDYSYTDMNVVTSFTSIWQDLDCDTAGYNHQLSIDQDFTVIVSERISINISYKYQVFQTVLYIGVGWKLLANVSLEALQTYLLPVLLSNKKIPNA